MRICGCEDVSPPPSQFGAAWEHRERGIGSWDLDTVCGAVVVAAAAEESGWCNICDAVVAACCCCCCCCLLCNNSNNYTRRVCKKCVVNCIRVY